MSIELVPLIADALADLTIGVNALLPRIPREFSDDVPAPVVQIADEVRTGWLARHHVPDSVMRSGPALAVAQSNEATWETEMQRASASVGIHMGDASVVILYLVRKSTSEDGMRWTKDVLRAARWSLLLLMQSQDATRRERHDVMITDCTGLKQVPAEGERGDALISGALIASYATQETVPLLTTA